MSKVKSYNFWVRLASAVILIARIILAKFGYELDSALVIDIATLVAGLLVVLGIINEPTGITISYNERNVNNDSMNLKNKGDNYMTEQIKSDLMTGVQRLTEAIQTNSGSGASELVQIITSMLDVISAEMESVGDECVVDDAENKEVATEPSEMQVNFEHSASDEMDEKVEVVGEVEGDEKTCVVDTDADCDSLINGLVDGDVVIGTNEDGFARMVEYVETIENEKTAEVVEEIKTTEKIENLEKLVAQADEIHPEMSVETAISVLLNNPDGIEQLKNYIINSDFLSEISKAQ